MSNVSTFLKIQSKPQNEIEEKINEIDLLKKNIKSITEIESFNINPSNYFSTFVKIQGSELTDKKLNTLFIFPLLIIDIQNFYLNDNGDLITNKNQSECAGINEKNQFTNNAYKFIFKKFFSPLPKIENIKDYKNIQPTVMSTEEERFIKINKNSNENIKMMRLDDNHLIVFFNGIKGLRSENSDFVNNGLIFLKKYWDNIMKKTKGLKKITYKEILESNNNNLKKSIQDEIINKYGISLNSLNFIHISTDLSRVCSGFIIGRDLIKNTGVENCIKILLDFDKKKFNTKLKTSDLKESNIKNLVKAMPYIDFYNTLNKNNNKLDPKIKNNIIEKLYNDIYFNNYNYSINSNEDLNIYLNIFNINLNIENKKKKIIQDLIRYKYSLYNKKYVAYNQINYIFDIDNNNLINYNKNLIQNSDKDYLFKENENYLLDTNSFYNINNNKNLYIDKDKYNKYTQLYNYKNIIYNKEEFIFNYNNILTDINNYKNIINLLIKDKEIKEFEINNIINNIKYKSSDIITILFEYEFYLNDILFNTFYSSTDYIDKKNYDLKIKGLLYDIKSGFYYYGTNRNKILDPKTEEVLNSFLNDEKIKNKLIENTKIKKLFLKLEEIQNYNNRFNGLNKLNFLEIINKIISEGKITYRIGFINTRAILLNKYDTNVFTRDDFFKYFDKDNKYHMILLTYFIINIKNKYNAIENFNEIGNFQYKDYIKKILELDQETINLHFNYLVNNEFKITDLETICKDIFYFGITSLFIFNYLNKYQLKNINFNYDDPKNIYSNMNPNYMIISYIMSITFYNLINKNNLDKYIDNNLPKVLNTESGLHILNKFINNNSGIYPKGYKLPLINNIDNSINLNIKCLKSQATKRKIISSLILNATDNLNINKNTLFETDDIRKNYIFFQTYGVNLLSKITCVYDDNELQTKEIINTNIIPSNLFQKINILNDDTENIILKEKIENMIEKIKENINKEVCIQKKIEWKDTEKWKDILRKDYQIIDVGGNGDCFFNVIGHILKMDIDKLRSKISKNILESDQENYINFLKEDYYCENDNPFKIDFVNLNKKQINKLLESYQLNSNSNLKLLNCKIMIDILNSDKDLTILENIIKTSAEIGYEYILNKDNNDYKLKIKYWADQLSINKLLSKLYLKDEYNNYRFYAITTESNKNIVKFLSDEYRKDKEQDLNDMNIVLLYYSQDGGGHYQLLLNTKTNSYVQNYNDLPEDLKNKIKENLKKNTNQLTEQQNKLKNISISNKVRNIRETPFQWSDSKVQPIKRRLDTIKRKSNKMPSQLTEQQKILRNLQKEKNLKNYYGNEYSNNELSNNNSNKDNSSNNNSTEKKGGSKKFLYNQLKKMFKNNPEETKKKIRLYMKNIKKLLN
jgi:hypothetical protein